MRPQDYAGRIPRDSFIVGIFGSCASNAHLTPSPDFYLDPPSPGSLGGAYTTLHSIPRAPAATLRG